MSYRVRDVGYEARLAWRGLRSASCLKPVASYRAQGVCLLATLRVVGRCFRHISISKILILTNKCINLKLILVHILY